MQVDPEQEASATQSNLLLELQMNGFPTCAVCFNEFDLVEPQAVVLPSCGHTFCRSCAWQLPNKKCGTCRKPFATFANNWVIHGLVEERLRGLTSAARANLKERKKMGGGGDNDDDDVVAERASLQQEVNATSPEIHLLMLDSCILHSLSRSVGL